MCGSPHMETRGDIHTKEIKYGSESAIFGIVPNKYKWNSSANKAGTSKGQTGKQDLKT